MPEVWPSMTQPAVQAQSPKVHLHKQRSGETVSVYNVLPEAGVGGGQQTEGDQQQLHPGRGPGRLGNRADCRPVPQLGAGASSKLDSSSHAQK